jgi:hypothetical protein
VWQGRLGGRRGWPGRAGGQEVPGGHCPPGPLLGRKGRRLWLGTGLAISLPRRKLSSVSSFISRPTSSWQWRKEELAAGRNVWRASVARAILGWGSKGSGTARWAAILLFDSALPASRALILLSVSSSPLGISWHQFGLMKILSTPVLYLAEL